MNDNIYMNRELAVKIARAYYKTVNDKRFSVVNRYMAEKELTKLCAKWNITVKEIRS